LLFSTTWAHPFTRVIGPGGDSLQFIWFLAWSSFALGHHLNPLFSGVVNAPAGANLMWNPAIPLPAALLSPLTRGLGPVFAYNALMTLGIALSGWCAFLALRRYVQHSFPAFVGGVLYGFSPYEMAHALDHPHVALAFAPPLVLIVLDDLLVRHRHPPRRMGAVLGLLAAVQLMTGEELLATMTLVALLATLVFLAITDRGKWRLRLLMDLLPMLRRQAGPVVSAACTFFLICCIPLAFQFFGPQRPSGPLQPRNVFVSDLLNFVIPTSLQQFAPGWARGVAERFSGSPAESTAYLGLPLLALLAWTAARAFRSRAVAEGSGIRANLVVRLTMMLVILCALLSLGLTLHIAGHDTLIPCAVLALPSLAVRKRFPARFLIYAVLAAGLAIAIVPVADNLLPARLMLFAFLAVALIVAFLLDQVLSLPLSQSFVRFPLPAQLAPKRVGIARAIAGGAIGLALLPLFPRIPFPSTLLPLPLYFRSSAVVQLPQDAVVLVAPFSRSGHGTAMLWQALAGMRFRMPEGYLFVPHHANIADPPPSATLDVLTALELGQQPTITPTLRAGLLADLERWQVSAVLVGPMPYRTRVVALYTALLGNPPREDGGVAVFRR